MKRSKLALLIFIGPAVLLYLLIYLYPTVRTTVMSFFTTPTVTSPVSQWSFFGFGNYRTLIDSNMFQAAMVNLVKILVYGGVITLFIAMVFAVILTSGVKFKSFFRAVIYLPNVIAAVALGTMWLQYVYNAKYGLLKTVFETLGLKTLAAVQWTSPEHIFGSMLVAYCFGMVGYFMTTYMAGIERIPRDCYEAATIEGANVFQQFFRITLPLLKGVFRTTVVLWGVRSVGFFVWSQVFTPLIPMRATITPAVYMYRNVFGVDENTLVDVGAGAAVGVIMTITVIVMFLVINLILRDKDDLEF
ncbi:carbohydrate ABC transporter permease [Breznakiella homolactica]|uniref:Sugar ABC transporter permease n=1 Tax=Breznakiella homolactica TaxID=2798577 RepID=A0A7T7XKJ9_9SPIR|nr:sugar ABC transporter permease [Breznakiella homolactica]QQO08109.1 sugar ABC transporter permease [Breznakiella homolactica]